MITPSKYAGIPLENCHFSSVLASLLTTAACISGLTYRKINKANVRLDFVSNAQINDSEEMSDMKLLLNNPVSYKEHL